MKTTIVAGLSLFLFAGVSLAQERLPQERAQQLARLFVPQAAKLTDAQLQTDVDLEKPCCITKGKLGAMVIPDKKLSAELLDKVGKAVAPVGQLWMRGLTPVSGGTPTPGDKLRKVTVTIQGEDHQLPCCFLGVRQKAGGGLELVVYAKDKDPLLTLPLEKVAIEQELPIELDAKKGENDMGILIITALGKYQAMLTVAQAP